MTATERYIYTLTCLKNGELGILRSHAGLALDESVAGFDLFAGLWWPLRQRNERAPRRKVAWLIAKLYAFCPIEHSAGETLISQLSKCRPNEERARERFRQQFDGILNLPLSKIENLLRWVLDQVSSKNLKIDWVKLTNDLSIWERKSTRLKWAMEFLKTYKEDSHAN